MPRIIFLRHGEQPSSHGLDTLDKEQLEKEDSEIGLTIQGAIRAYMMPKLVNKLLGKKSSYALHTYTNCKHDVPVSRAYYTTQLLRDHPNCKNVTLYNKSENIYELVQNIKNQASTYQNIIVCWEHGRIPKIIQSLINLNKAPNYEKKVKKFGKKNYEITYQTVDEKKVSEIQRCAPAFADDNDKYLHEVISGEKELEYSPVWDVSLKKCTYKVYPGVVIKKAEENNWSVAWYL